jgi:hypothetical protein
VVFLARQPNKLLMLNRNTMDENLSVSPHGSNTILAAVTVGRITPENITSISEK